MNLHTTASLLSVMVSAQDAESGARVGQPADIAPSAYRYRADRPAGEKPRPAPEDMEITTLDSQGAASSWWNNLKAEKKPVKPAVTDRGDKRVYDLSHNTCGLVISVGGDKPAADYAVPAVRVRVADTWKKMELEIEWGYAAASAPKDYSGRIETYDGVVGGLAPLDGDGGTTVGDCASWQSSAKTGARRGVKASLLYMGVSKWRKAIPFTSQREDVARTIVTVWTKSGNFSFLAADLENGPILAPEYGFFVRRTSALPAAAPGGKADMKDAPPYDMASTATSAAEFVKALQGRNLDTIRQRLRAHPERTWQEAVTAMRGSNLPPHPIPPDGTQPAMQVQVPCERLAAQWNLGRWHLTRHCGKNPENGRLWFNDYPYGILATETYMILAALNLMGDHKAAEDGFQQWVSLPMQPVVEKEKQAPNGGCADDKQHGWALPDRPNGLFSDGLGCLTHAEGPPGAGGHMDGVHAFGPGSIGWALVEHYRLTGDKEWFRKYAPRIKANVEWILRQRRTVRDMVPGGERLWCEGLQPALQVTPDSGGLWMQFYEAEAYYWVSIRNFAEALATIDPVEGKRLQLERTSNMHLAGDDIPVFIRSFLNCYAVDILEKSGYIFNEHAVHGPPDKIYEEACFLERFRNMLVMESGDSLWLARATPRAWLRQGLKISVTNAPTYFGPAAYEMVSDVDHGRISATVEMPSRKPPTSVLLRFRHPAGAPIRRVTVNGSDWTAFDAGKETLELKGLSGVVAVTADY